MNIKKTLISLVRAITEEAERNDAFKESLERVLSTDKRANLHRQLPVGSGSSPRGGRRTPAVFDPVEVARQGEDALRSRLATLSLEQLRDIVAQYGMDPGKLVMKWKDVKRVIDRVVELALARATKGDAFRSD